jgi:hypothetical protein
MVLLNVWAPVPAGVGVVGILTPWYANTWSPPVLLKFKTVVSVPEALMAFTEPTLVNSFSI